MVCYDIHKDERDYYNYWFHEPKKYPWIIYPYYSFAGIDINKDFKGIGGKFGISELPPLESYVPISMKSQLTFYITNYLKEKINLTIFDELGFEIEDGEINVSVIIGDNDVIAFLEYPLVINKTITNKITKVNYFYTNPQVRLKKVYEFTNEIINKDITDILFDISSPDNDKEYIKIEKIIKDAYENDDIAVIKDEKSMLYAEPYTFQFSRENRYPALRYIPITKLTFSGSQAIMNPIIEKDMIILKADDPDEDGISFEIEPSLPYHITQADLDKEYVILTVYANEEGSNNQDWQKIRIGLIGES